MIKLLGVIVPFALGAIGLLQGALNRKIASHLGVTQTTLITNLGTVTLCLIAYFSARNFPEYLHPMFQIKMPITTYKWWYVIPPVFGFLIISGMPYAISEFGAVKVTVGLIAAQMVVSVLWDLFVEGIGLNTFKIIGITMAALSVIFTSLAKQ